MDECRKTASLSKQLFTLFCEAGLTVDHKLSRLIAEDSFIPIGTAWEYLVPNIAQIKQAIDDLNA